MELLIKMGMTSLVKSESDAEELPGELVPLQKYSGSDFARISKNVHASPEVPQLNIAS